MSATVDNRVVKMTFDNKSFEKGVDDTLKTIEKLNKSLEFKDASKGFDNIEQAADSVSFSKLESNIQTLTDRFSGLGIIGMRIWSNIGDSIYNLITGPIRAVESAIGNVTNQIKTGGWNRAANLDKAANLLKNLGQGYDSVNKSADTVEITVDGITKTVANRYKAIDEAVTGTSYSFDEAAMAVSGFVAANEEMSNEDLTKTLRAAQGVASTYGKDLNQIAVYLQKIQGQGYLSQGIISDMKMANVSIEPIIQKYLGIENATKDQMEKIYKSGAITFDMVVDALYDKFKDSLGEANNTLEGATNNMKSAMSRIGAVFYEPMIQSLIMGENQVRVFMNGIKNAVVGSGIADEINKIVSDVIGTIDKLFFIGDNKTKKLNARGEFVIRNIQSLLNGITSTIKIAIEIFTDFGIAFKEVFAGKDATKAPTLLNRFAVKMATLLHTVQANKDKIIDGFKGFLYVLKPIVKLLGLLLKIAFKVIGILLKIAIVIVGLVGNLITLIVESKIFRSVIEKVTGAIDKFVGWIKQAKDFVADFFESLKIGEKVTEVFWDIVNAVKEFNEKYKPLETAIDAIKTAFEKVYDVIRNAFNTLTDFIKIDIKIPTIDEIKEKFEKLGEKIKWAFDNPKDAAEEFIQKLKEVKDYIATGFSDAVDGINDKFSTFKDWIKGFKDGFGDANKSLEDFAESDNLEKTEKKFSVLNGISTILNGFKDALEGVWGVIKSVAGNIKEFFEKVFSTIGDQTGIKDFASFIEFLVKMVKLLKEAGLASLAIQLGEFFGTLAEAMKKGMGGNSSILKALPDAMMKIAIAMGIMALVVIALGSIKPEAAKQAEEILTYLVILAAVMAKVIKSIGSLKTNSESAIEAVDDAGRKFKIGGSFAKTFAKSIGNTFGKAAEMWALGEMIKSIAFGVLEIAAAFWVLSKAFSDKDGNFDGKRLAAGIAAFIVIMAAMTVVIKLILSSLKKVQSETKGATDLIKDRGGAKKQGKEWVKELHEGESSKLDTSTPTGAILATAALVMSISTAVLVMASALAILGAIPGNVLAQGSVAIIGIVGVIIGIMAALLAITKALGKNKEGNVDNTALAKQFAGMAAFVIAISAAILLLIPAIIVLGLLMKADSKMVWSGIGAIAVLGVIMSVCGAIIGASANKEGSLKLLIGLAITMYVLISQIRKLASNDVDLGNLIASMTGITVILLVATLMIKAAEKVEKALNVAALMGSLAAAIAACGYAISAVAQNDYGKTWSSVGAIIVLIAAIGGVMILLSKLSGPMGITVIEGLAVAFVGIGAAVFLLAAAMRILLPIIDQIYDNRDGVRKKLAAFADIIAATIVGFIASLLEALANETLNLINQLGRLLLNLLVGIVDWLCVNAEEIGTAIGNLLAALVVIIAVALKVFIGDLIAVICKELGIASPSKVFASIGEYIIKGLVNGISNAFGEVGEVVAAVIDMILSPILKIATTIIEGGEKIIGGLVSGIKNQFKTITGVIGDVINLIKNPLNLENWLDLGSTIVNGISNGLKAGLSVVEGAVKIISAPIQGLQTLADTALEHFLGSTSPTYVSKDAKAEAAEKKLTSELMADKAFNSALNDYKIYATNYAELMKTGLRKVKVGSEMLRDVNGDPILDGNHNPIYRDVYETRLNLTEQEKRTAQMYLNIMEERQKTLTNIYKDAVEQYRSQDEDLANRMNEIFVNDRYYSGSYAYRSGVLLGSMLGKDILEGLQQGMSAMKETGEKSMVQFIDGAKVAAEINSPSRVFKWIGNMIMAGLGVGINDSASTVDDIFATAIGGIEEIAENASITPVFDLSEIQNESEKAASAMMDMKTNIPQEVDLLNNTNASKIDYLGESVDGLSSNLSTATLEQIITTQNGLIQALSNKLNDMGVYIDGKTLVGSVITDIDKGLGARIGQIGRSVAR